MLRLSSTLPTSINMHTYLSIYACAYACMYVYICTYVCACKCIYVYIHVFMYKSMPARRDPGRVSTPWLCIHIYLG
jgi:hypothetical protein